MAFNTLYLSEADIADKVEQAITVELEGPNKKKKKKRKHTELLADMEGPKDRGEQIVMFWCKDFIHLLC